MQIKLNSWEINVAIKYYVKDKYNLDIDFQEMHEYPYIEYLEYKHAYKKHKNGKLKKCKDGYSIIDHENTKYETKCVEFNDDASINFYID